MRSAFSTAFPCRMAVGVTVVLLTACTQAPQEASSAPTPPLPADMTAFDGEIVEQIQTQVAALEVNAQDAILWRELGMLYHAHAHLDLAAECYRQSRSLDPATPRTHFFLALAEQESGALAAAIESMGRVTELEPDFFPAHWRLGLVLLEEGNTAAALASLEEALARAPGDASVHHALARAHLQAGTPQQAAQRLEAWLTEHPDDLYARFLLGSAYRQMGRPDEAREQLTLGQGAQPSWSDPWSDEIEARRAGFPTRLTRATELLESDPVGAAEALGELRSERPENVTVLINLGIGYRRSQRFDDSAEALTEAVRLEPSRGLAHFHLALTHSEAGRIALALEHAERSVELQPNSSKSHAMLGELLARSGQIEAAAESYGRAARDPQDPMWLLRLGDLLCQLGQWSEALAPLDAFLQRTGPHPGGLLLQGVARANAGDPQGARSSLERALEQSPGDQRILQALRQLSGESQEGGVQ